MRSDEFSSKDYNRSLPAHPMAKRHAPTSLPSAPHEMIFLSAYPAKRKTGNSPTNFNVREYCDQFVYDSSAGEGVTVYILGEVNIILMSQPMHVDRKQENAFLGSPVCATSILLYQNFLDFMLG